MEENFFFGGGGEKHAIDQRLSVVIIKKFENIFLSTGPQNGKIIKITKYLFYCRNSVYFLWNLMVKKYFKGKISPEKVGERRYFKDDDTFFVARVFRDPYLIFLDLSRPLYGPQRKSEKPIKLPTVLSHFESASFFF